MTRLVNGIILDEGQCLLLQIDHRYLLPGGKPYESETDEGCIARAIRHGLSNTRTSSIYPYKKFKDLVHIQGGPLEIECYHVEIIGLIGKPSGPVKAVEWIRGHSGFETREDIGNNTRAILLQLRRDLVLY